MSYEDYIEEFWLKARTLRLDTTQIALGLALLHEWRGAGFPSRHSVPNEVLCDLLSVNIKTFRAARKRLVDGGLIILEEGNARKQPVYVFGVAGVVPRAMEVVEVPPPPKKDVPRPRARKVKVADGEPSLFTEQEMAQPKRGRKDFVPPPLSEVVAICTGKGMTELQAKEFYDYYNAQEWFTSAGVRIKNVDSMVNRWLTIQRKRDESDRRLVQSRQSTADNIHDAQQYIIREMQQSVLGKTEEGSGRFLEELP